jgi:hypothetical protein
VLVRRHAALAVASLTTVLVVGYLLATSADQHQVTPGAREAPTASFDPDPAMRRSRAPPDSAARREPPTGDEEETVLLVRDGFGRLRPFTRIQLHLGEDAESVVELAATDSGELLTSQLPRQPTAGTRLSSDEESIMVLTPTWGRAVDLGHVLVAVKERLRGQVILVGATQGESGRLLPSVVFTVLSLPEITYTDRRDLARVNQDLARRSLFNPAVTGAARVFDEATGRFELTAYASPEARIVVSLDGWESSGQAIEAALQHGGDIGEIRLTRVPVVNIRVIADPGIDVPRSIGTVTWRGGRLGDPIRADAFSSTPSARGGMWQMIDPLSGRWAVGRDAVVELTETAGEIAVPLGFRVDLRSIDVAPDVVPTTRRSDDGDVVVELRRAASKPSVQIICGGHHARGGFLTFVEHGDIANLNGRIRLTANGRLLAERFEVGKTYALDLAGLEISTGPKPRGTRYLRWRGGLQEVNVDQLPTTRPKVH